MSNTLPQFDAAIDSRRRINVPPDAIAMLDWSGAISAAVPVELEFAEPGQLVIWPGGTMETALNSAKDDPAAQDIIKHLFYPTQWGARGEQLTLPRSAALHVLDNIGISGNVWVLGARDRIELWSHSFRARFHSGLRGIVGEYLP